MKKKKKRKKGKAKDEEELDVKEKLCVKKEGNDGPMLLQYMINRKGKWRIEERKKVEKEEEKKKWKLRVTQGTPISGCLRG